MSGVLDPALVMTLLAVSEESSFSRAGERLGLTQQAISAQIKRLEALAGRRLVERRTSDVRLTGDGEALIAYARLLAETTERIRHQFSAVPLSGTVRIGALEGFASTGLAAVLVGLRRVQPDLEVLVETAATETLLARLEGGNLDVIFGGQRCGQRRGETVATVRLGWYGHLGGYADKTLPVRLVLRPEPSLPRTVAIEALVRAGRPYGIVFESRSRTSLKVAALAGLGVSVFATFFDNGMAPAETSVLPELENVEFFLATGREKNDAILAVAELVRQSVASMVRHGGDHRYRDGIE